MQVHNRPEELTCEDQNSRDESSTVQKAGKYWTVTASFLIILGFHYLRSYLSSKNIPFPMELNVLSSTLLMMGAASILVILSLASVLLFTVILRFMPFGIDYSVFFEPKEDENTAEDTTNRSPWGCNIRTLKRSITLFYLGFVPVATLFLIIFLDQEQIVIQPRSILTAILVFAILGMSLLFALFKHTKEISFWLMLGFCFFVQSTVAVFWTVPAGIILQTGLIDGDAGFYALVIVLAVLCCVGLVPPDESEKQDHSSTKNAIRSTILRNPTAFFAFFMIALLTIFPPVASVIGKASLRFFEIGGGIPHEIVLTESLSSNLTDLKIRFDTEKNCIRSLLIYRVNETAYYEVDSRVIPLKTDDLIVNLSAATKADCS